MAATLPAPVGGIVRVMLFETETGTYLFLYNTRADAPCVADEWYERPETAVERCRREFGVRPEDWQTIPDPMPGSPHDRHGGET